MSDKTDEENFQRWKLLIPYLYDWFTHHNLVWPSLSCRSAALLTSPNKTLLTRLCYLLNTIPHHDMPDLAGRNLAAKAWCIVFCVYADYLCVQVGAGCGQRKLQA